MTNERAAEEQVSQDGADAQLWLLVDHSSTEAALLPVAEALQERGVAVELVTITEVIGTVARGALAGGAERLLRGLRVVTGGGAREEDLVGAIRRRQPDVLVITEPRYARAIGVLENLTGVESLQVGLMRDFFVDEKWLNGQLHSFVVPLEESRDELQRLGVSADQVQVAGPALRPGFEADPSRQEIRGELGFGDDEQVVLVRGDGFDLTTLEKVVFQSTLADKKARFVFHHDGDGATASTLRRAAEKYGLAAAMFGRVHDLGRYIVAADVVLASGADPYLPEVLACGTPALLVGAGERGWANAEVLEELGQVQALADPGRLGATLERFLKPENLEEFRAKGEQWGGDARHSKVVDALEEMARDPKQWRVTHQVEPVAEQEEEGEQETEKPSGPFETIGKGAPRGGGRSSTEGESREQRADLEELQPGPSRLSRAEAKEQLAQLILAEREAERRLQEADKQQERWHGRLDLARQWNETDLAEEAETILRGYIDEARELEEELQDLRRQKEKLKEAAGAGRQKRIDGDLPPEDEHRRRGSGMEERFQKMEVDRDLEGLKDRIRRELGE